MGGSLYQRIEKECEAHISAGLQSLVGQSEDLVVFLSLVEKCWQDFCDQMLMIRGIALYLDRTYVKQTPNVRSLWDMGLQLFRKHLSLASEVEHKTVFGLLKMIDSERYFQLRRDLVLLWPNLLLAKRELCEREISLVYLVNDLDTCSRKCFYDWLFILLLRFVTTAVSKMY